MPTSFHAAAGRARVVRPADQRCRPRSRLDEPVDIDPDGQGRYQLHAASELDFLQREGDVEVTFVRGEDGAVTGLLFRQAGQEVPAERLE